MLEKIQTYQQVLFDLTANYLEPMSSAFQRLAYLSSLQSDSTGKYVHTELASLYGEEPVNQVIAHCHEEVFERLLEMPLNAQGEELRLQVGSLPGTIEENAIRYKKDYRDWVPRGAPSYLRELYCSNLDVLLELLLDDRPRSRPNN
jgi:hypothetical protein